MNKPLKKELKVDSVKIDKVLPDTTFASDSLFPVKIKKIGFSDLDNDPKYRVTAENGVVYYTDKKPKVGDIAFYLNDNDEITDKNGNKLTKQ